MEAMADLWSLDSDGARVKYAHDYLTHTIDYVSGSPYNQTITVTEDTAQKGLEKKNGALTEALKKRRQQSTCFSLWHPWRC